MYIDKITYQKTYNLGNYTSERIGVELTLNEGEDAKQALIEAQALVEEYHKESAAQYPMPCIVETIVDDTKSKEIEKSIEQAFNELQVKLNEIEFKEDAIAYLETTDFRHLIKAKSIVNNKPSKTI